MAERLESRELLTASTFEVYGPMPLVEPEENANLADLASSVDAAAGHVSTDQGFWGVECEAHAHAHDHPELAHHPGHEHGHHHEDSQPAPKVVRPNAAVGPKRPLSAAPELSSLPGAEATIFLDFDGHTVTGTAWNQANQDRAIAAPAFDLDGDARTFSTGEIEAIDRIWQRVAEDFAPFTVNVTTVEPASGAFRQGGRAIRVLVSSNVDQQTGNRWYPNVGGVAYVGSWRWQSDTPVWVFADRLGGHEQRIADAVSHEVGHSLGLSHDGIEDGEEYYSGHGDGNVSWAPLMGTGYSKALTQWSRGEYRSASNHQDDLSLITAERNGIDFRPDDHANAPWGATELRLGQNNVEGTRLGSGVIERPTDQDAFRIQVSAQGVELKVAPATHGANLDLQVTVLDGQGRRQQVLNPSNALDVHVTLPAGTHYLILDGVGKGDPQNGGFSDYGSLGQYSITVAPPRVSSASTPVTSADLPAISAAMQSARRHRTAYAMSLVREAAQQDSFADMLEVLARWRVSPPTG